MYDSVLAHRTSENEALRIENEAREVSRCEHEIQRP